MRCKSNPYIRSIIYNNVSIRHCNVIFVRNQTFFFIPDECILWCTGRLHLNNKIVHICLKQALMAKIRFFTLNFKISRQYHEYTCISNYLSSLYGIIMLDCCSYIIHVFTLSCVTCFALLLTRVFTCHSNSFTHISIDW